MKALEFEGFKKGHIFPMPETWIWVDVIDTVNFVVTDNRFGIGKRAEDCKNEPCNCVLLGEYKDKFLLRYIGHNNYIPNKTLAPNGIVFMLPQKDVLDWHRQIIEQNEGKEELTKALKAILGEA